MLLPVIIASCLVAVTQAARQGPCFKFNGSAHIEFTHSHLSNDSHYVLTFKTTSPTGTLLFVNGPHDYEALFLQDGRLAYTLVNPEDNGVGGTYGTSLLSKHKVNNGTFLTVELFRNRRVRRGLQLMPGEEAPIRTGMIIRDPRTSFTEQHFSRHGLLQNVFMLHTIYIGGRPQDILPDYPVEYFTGQIKNMREKTGDMILEDPYRNTGVSRCIPRRSPS